jgi:DNA polymerase III subunit epsilon
VAITGLRTNDPVGKKESSMEFMALDVETANPDMSSICQIGLAVYKDATLIAEWKTLVDPQDFFDPVNVSIHGIDEKAIRESPKLPDVADLICNHMTDRVVVCHTHFDRVSLHQASLKHNLSFPSCTWLDTARVARRTWEECAWSGYGLKNVCDMIGHKFAHHDALEDAKAAAQILLAAMTRTGLDLDGWLKRAGQPICLSAASKRGSATSEKGVARAGDPEGPLFGEVLAFTGALAIPRREAAEMAAKVGCAVSDGVNKQTSILVVGDQDIRKLAGNEKSTKHRKAEDLILKGQQIRILRETDFREFVTSASDANRVI